jgi:hypothetical protein
MPSDDEPGIDKTEQLKIEIAAIKGELEILQKKWDLEMERMFRELAYDRQRLSALEHPEDRNPTPTELDHLQKIEKHLKASPWHSASFAEIRGLLGVSPGRVSQLVKKLDPQRFEIRQSASDYKARTLVLKGRFTL